MPSLLGGPNNRSYDFSEIKKGSKFFKLPYGALGVPEWEKRGFRIASGPLDGWKTMTSLPCRANALKASSVPSTSTS